MIYISNIILHYTIFILYFYLLSIFYFNLLFLVCTFIYFLLSIFYLDLYHSFVFLLFVYNCRFLFLKSYEQEAKDLVMYFAEFNQGNTARLELVKSSNGWEGRRKVSFLIIFSIKNIQAAAIARRLSSIAQEVDLPDTEKVHLYHYSF